LNAPKAHKPPYRVALSALYSEKLDKTVSNINKFREWSWKPDHGRFDLTVQFREDQIESQKYYIIRTSLKEALKQVGHLLPEESA
jgi:hypothetical protein